MSIHNNLKTANKKFLKNMVESASPMQLIIILYEGAQQWLHMAKQEIQKNKEAELPNWSNFSQYMDMALQIISHLQESLDHNQAEEVAERLFALYDFIKRTLSSANAYKKEEDIDNVVKLLKDMKSYWQDAVHSRKTES